MNLTALANIATPDADKLNASAGRALRMVESMSIDTREDYGLAADELKAIKAKADAIEAQRTSITGPLNNALKAVNDLFRAPKAYLAQAEQTIKGKMITFDTEQERIAAEAKRRAEEAVAAERRRLEEEARKAREAAEAEQRRLAAIEAERQRAARAEQERIEREAAEARAKGDREAAERAEAEAAHQRELEAAARAQAVQQAALVEQNAALEVAAIEQVSQVITAAPVVVAQAKTAGISTAKGFDFEVVDVVALIKDVAAKIDAQPGLAGALRPDDVRLRAMVKGLGMNLGLAGIRVFEKKTLRAAA